MTKQVLQRNNLTGEMSHNDTDSSTVAGNGLLGVGATKGFLAIPTSATTPTGVPADVPPGYVALAYCLDSNKLAIYDGGWVLSAALA